MVEKNIRDGEPFMSHEALKGSFKGANVLFFFMALTLLWDVHFEINHLLFFFIFLVLRSEV